MYTDKYGNDLPIGSELGKGGEATVFALSDNREFVAKIYNDRHFIDEQKLLKLEKMCDLYDDKISQYCAWPQKIIYSDGKPVGYIMRNISCVHNQNDSEYIKIIKFYVSQSRRKYFPNAEYKFMVHVALNLACAIETLHDKGIVIGDLNESNIYVNNTDAMVQLIDCDSYQIDDFLCEIGKVDYIAPELPNLLRGVKRTPNHDNFALAVMLFLILVGKHPYSGIGTPQELRQSITQYLYCYGKDAKKKNISAQYPFSEIYNLLNDEIKNLFEQAFNSQIRPSAKDWSIALQKFENELVNCQKNKLHWYNPKSNKCIWCDLEDDGFYAFGNAPIKPIKVSHDYSVNSSISDAPFKSKRNFIGNFFDSIKLCCSKIIKKPSSNTDKIELPQVDNWGWADLGDDIKYPKSYKYYYSSVKGTSHEKTNTPKQDNLCVTEFKIDGTNYLISAVADGAGTAKYSDISSKHICKFLTKKMSIWLESNELSSFSQDVFCSWIKEFQNLLNRFIKMYKLTSIRDFATTILFVVLSDKTNLFVQIGDGAISVGNATELNCVFIPQKGEYANTTHFATESNFENSLMFKFINENIEHIAMHTDGIEMISLINLEKPSLSFFNPFFNSLEDEPIGHNEGLSEELSDFLSSDRVNKRTNDDKTLVIITKANSNG